MMGLVTNTRGLRIETTQEGLLLSPSSILKRKWCKLMSLLMVLVVIVDIAFLGKLAMVDTLADLFYWSNARSCEEWLEMEDAVTYSRNFTAEPIFVSGASQV